MRQKLTFFAIITLLFSLSSIASAEVTITFDPDDLIQKAPDAAGSDVVGGRKVDQQNARRLHLQWASDFVETFYNPADPHPQPDDYNAYMEWRDSLGAGEGIASINTWFHDQYAVKSWGETVVIKTGTEVSGTSSDGWNMRLIENPYGLGGASVQWWTTDPTKYINTISDIGEFSITADLYWDTDGNGYDEGDTPVVAGDIVRFWLGNLNGDDPEFYIEDTQSIYYDGANYGYAARDQGSGFEAALTGVAGAPVPVPGSVLLGGIGVACVGWIKRRRAI